MEYTLMDAIEEAQKQIVEETDLSEQEVRNIFKKIIYNFLRL